MKTKEKQKPKMPANLADMLKQGSKVMRTVRPTESPTLDDYAKRLHLPYEHCPKCQEDTPTIECEEYKICAKCEHDKPKENDKGQDKTVS